MGKKVVVTGMGMASAYGLGVQAFLDGTLAGKSAVRPITYFETSLYRSPQGAQVCDSIWLNQQLRQDCGNPEEDAAFFATLAAKEAIADADVAAYLSNDEADRFGCVSATLCAGARNYEALGRKYFAQSDLSAADLDNDATSPHATQINYQVNYLADYFGIRGPSSLISTACASGTDAIGYALDLIRYGQCDRVLVVGGDIISETIHAAFNSVFSITKECPRPFDKDRAGFVIGEGGACLILEAEDMALSRGAKIYAEVAGYGLSNSASHLTAPSKNGMGESFAVVRALQDAQITPNEVDFVNAHGTGTPHNDRSEVLALIDALGERSKDVSITSIKSMIGHCMGAAGLVEAISTIHSVQTGQIPPTINFREGEDINPFHIVTNCGYARPIRYAVSNSFGFGGHNSSMVFGQYTNT